MRALPVPVSAPLAHASGVRPGVTARGVAAGVARRCGVASRVEATTASHVLRHAITWLWASVSGATDPWCVAELLPAAWGEADKAACAVDVRHFVLVVEGGEDLGLRHRFVLCPPLPLGRSLALLLVDSDLLAEVLFGS